jgi:hypothetical protein
VVEVNQPHAHTRRRVGKSDPIDAEMAGRLFQAGKATAVPKQTNGIVEPIRLLRVARDSAVKSRTAATVQIRDLIITAPQPLRDQLADRKTLRGKATICARFRLSESNLSQPVHAAKFALRSLARRIETLDREIENLDQQLEPLVAAAHHAAARNLHPAMPDSCSSPRVRTSTSSTARHHSQRSAAQARSRPHQARPSATASIPAAIAKPTERCTSSRSVACATATAPAPTSSGAPAKANPNARSCAV